MKRTAAFLLLSFLSCTNHSADDPLPDEPVEGGPCDYQTSVLPVIVTKITKEGEANYRIDFSGLPSDSLTYYFNTEAPEQNFGTHINEIHIGDTFQVEKKTPAHGYCKTSVEVQLIKYKTARPN